MKPLVNALCALTILAVAYLSWSVLLLHPPRANYPAWFTFAGFVIVQTMATLVLTATPMPSLRVPVTGGGAVLVAAGVWMIRGTLTSAHFEGYALILGAMLVAQGIATIAAFARTIPRPA